MAAPGAKSRWLGFERKVELELEPLELGERIGLALIFASLCVESCGAVLFFGSGSLHVRGQTGWTGLALMLGGAGVFGLTVWLLQPHKAAKHAAHRFRHHVRKARRALREQAQPMTDAEFDALEDVVDRASTTFPG
jgi:histidine ammonia-lyase